MLMNSFFSLDRIQNISFYYKNMYQTQTDTLKKSLDESVFKTNKLDTEITFLKSCMKIVIEKKGNCRIKTAAMMYS